MLPLLSSFASPIDENVPEKIKGKSGDTSLNDFKG
jgi:hypothetical protein